MDGVERNFRHDELSKRHFGEGKGQIFEAGRDEHTIEQPAHSSRVLFDLLSENHVHTVVLVPLEHPIFYEVPYPKKTDDCSTQSWAEKYRKRFCRVFLEYRDCYVNVGQAGDGKPGQCDIDCNVQAYGDFRVVLVKIFYLLNYES